MVSKIVKHILFILGVILFSLNIVYPAYSQKAKIDSLINLIDKSKEDTTTAVLYIKAAGLLNRSHPDSAMYYAQKGLELSEKIDFPRGIGGNLVNIGIIHWTKGEYNEALEAYDRAYKIYQKSGNLKGMSDCYLCKGVIHGIQGDYPKTLELFHIALTLEEKLKILPTQIISYNIQTKIYEALNDYEKALETYQIRSFLNDSVYNLISNAIKFTNKGVLLA